MSYYQDPNRAPSQLVAYIKAQTQVRIRKVTDTKQLKSLCLQKRTCALILSPGPKLVDHYAEVCLYVSVCVCVCVSISFCSFA